MNLLVIIIAITIIESLSDESRRSFFLSFVSTDLAMQNIFFAIVSFLVHFKYLCAMYNCFGTVKMKNTYAIFVFSKSTLSLKKIIFMAFQPNKSVISRSPDKSNEI